MLWRKSSLEEHFRRSYIGEHVACDMSFPLGMRIDCLGSRSQRFGSFAVLVRGGEQGQEPTLLRPVDIVRLPLRSC